MGMAAVAAEHVYKNFGKQEIVKDFTLRIEDHEFLVLVGPSGCGKSTTLRMVAGLEEVTSGDLFIGERRVNDLPPQDRDVAMVFQNYALYPHMRVYDNLAFPLRMHRKPRAEVDRRVREAARMLGLEELLHRYPRELSGGQRQRVALGRAIVRDPLVYLMDEPLSNLDAKLRVQTRAELKRLHATLRTTTIYVTHDQVEAMTMGDRLVVMNQGVVQQVGAPHDIYRQPANVFVATFIGSPAMNIVRGRLVREGGQVRFAGDGWQLRLPEPYASAFSASGLEEALMGIRPESLVVDTEGAEAEAPGVLEAGVDLTEPLGAETLVHLRVGNDRLVARVGAAATAAEGERVRLRLAPAGVHLFDAASERAVA
jgi:multiple sugar transport system ATP-binding protein